MSYKHKRAGESSYCLATIKDVRRHIPPHTVTEVLSRRGCLDGNTALWEFWTQRGFDTRFTWITDQDRMEDQALLGGGAIILLDVLPDSDVLKRMDVSSHRLVVLCRTPSVRDACMAQGIFYHYTDKHAVSVIVWRYLHEAEDPPYLVEYVEDYVLGTKRRAFSAEVIGGLQSLDFSFDAWEAAQNNLLGVKQDGEAILRAGRRMVTHMVDQAYMVHVVGYDVPCVTASVMSKEVGDELLKVPAYIECPFVVTRQEVVEDEEPYSRWDLWSRGEVDVYALLSKHSREGGPTHAWMRSQIFEPFLV